jgi:hypothetical protein
MKLFTITIVRICISFDQHTTVYCCDVAYQSLDTLNSRQASYETLVDMLTMKTRYGHLGRNPVTEKENWTDGLM